MNHKPGTGSKIPGGGASAQSDCYRCGGKHQAAQCRFKEYECHFCRKKGHLASVCRKKKARSSKQEDSMDKSNANVVEGEEESPEYPLFNISKCTPSKPLLVKVLINGVSINMELDTGASVSLMGEDTYRLKQDSAGPLQQSSVKLHTYTVEQNDQSMTLPLIVMKREEPLLLGRNWLSVLKLDWQHIFRVESNCSLQDVLTRFKELFNERLGTVLGVKAKIRQSSSHTYFS